MMTAAPRVFIAQLAGTGVFDPTGDHLGRVRDVVVTLRLGTQAPRVLGILVEIQHRHRVFVPMGRVARIENDAVVLTTGSVNLKRFQPRPGETLVIGDLLDRAVTLSEDDTRVTVVDVAMEPTRSRDWLLVRVAVRRPGRLGRGRQLLQVEWAQVHGLSAADAADAQGTESLLAVLTGLRAADLASALQELPDKRREEVVAALDDERLADVLAELPEDEQVEILSALADERAADVLEAMDDDDAADLLGEMTAADQEKLLRLMEPDEADPVRRLMSYGDYTAGGLMTTEPVIMGPDATVAEALARVRHPDLSPALATQVFVVRPPQATPTGRFLGTAHLQRLLREPPSSLVSGLVEGDTGSVPPGATIEQVTRHLAIYNLVAVPVVDDNDRLLGAVSVDDVLDHLLPEDWRETAATTGELSGG